MKGLNRITRKVVTLLLSTSLIIAGSVFPVFADTSYGPGDTGSIEVTANINSTYTVELPAAVVLEPYTNEYYTMMVANFDYYITGLFLGANEAIAISPDRSALDHYKADASRTHLMSTTTVTLADQTDSSIETTLHVGFNCNRFWSSTHVGDIPVPDWASSDPTDPSSLPDRLLLGNDGSAASRTKGAGNMYINSSDFQAGNFSGTVNVYWAKVTME